MMKRRMYCLFDKATRTHMNPVVFVNDGEAVRWLTTVVNHKDESNPKLYPHQFVLRFLGEFDDISGKFESNVEDVMEATSVVQEQRRFTVEDLIEIFDKRYGLSAPKIEKGDGGYVEMNKERFK